MRGRYHLFNVIKNVFKSTAIAYIIFQLSSIRKQKCNNSINKMTYIACSVYRNNSVVTHELNIDINVFTLQNLKIPLQRNS